MGPKRWVSHSARNEPLKRRELGAEKAPYPPVKLDLVFEVNLCFT